METTLRQGQIIIKTHSLHGESSRMTPIGEMSFRSQVLSAALLPG